MPTGYTADIKDGISFEQFVLNCAKAFGACISMRDLPTDTPIPEKFEPRLYNATALKKAVEELCRLENMSESEAITLRTAEHQEAEHSRLKRLDENQNQLKAYRVMLDKVTAWAPPSTDHIELKNFMVKQIQESLKFDDMTKYYSEPTPLLRIHDFMKAKEDKVKADIKYHQEKHAEEVQRTNQRNEWVKLLRSSL